MNTTNSETSNPNHSLEYAGPVSVLKRSYVGAVVDSKILDPMNRALLAHVGFDFVEAKHNHDQRDGVGCYHMTILTPQEFRTVSNSLKLEGKTLDLPEKVNFTLLGVGTANNQKSRSWFAVAESVEVNEWRAGLGLPNRDLHITLAFEKGGDVHNVDKSANSLIPRCQELLAVLLANDGTSSTGLNVSPVVLNSPIDSKQYDAIADRVREFFGEEIYACSRVYSAWSYGTMGLDDFSLASEDEDIVESVVDIVLEELGLKGVASAN